MIDTINKVRRFGGYTGKMVVVGFLVLICWIASLLVLSVVSERSARQQEAEVNIGEQWGREQLVAGPVIVVPFNKFVVQPNGVNQLVKQTLYILPKSLKIDTKLDPEVRSRGIFSAPVYRSHLDFSGAFVMPDLVSLGVTPSSLLWNEATLVVGLSDTRSLTSSGEAALGGKPITFLPGAVGFNVDGQGVHAPLRSVSFPTSHSAPTGQSAGQAELPFSFSLELTGSKGISYLPLGEQTQISASAPWGAPSFFGAYLPDSETLENDNFAATWHISSLGRSYPSAWVGTDSGVSLNSYYGNSSDEFFGGFPTKTTPSFNSANSDAYGQALAGSAFGVNLFREVTFYTLVSRTVKYAILFIALTFLAFYLFEIISGTRVHPFQYLLIGAALVLFYLLLLSLSEQLGFAWAYLISAIMTLGLVTTYSASVLKAHKRAWMIATILAVLYAYLYAILQLEQYALLFGTLFLFVALAAVMRATRKIEWYKEVE